ncbi:hypothetical protein R1flu_013455 [Riccia fluitans]|uniref:Uncharacterized protein n=1 Tax=Riccia fluitans TaxID=41844 RepID=A0ABD1YEF8_9MARC
MQMRTFGSSRDSSLKMYSFELKKWFFPGPVLAFILVNLLLLSGVQSKPLVPAVVILGDSTVDVGVNNHLLTVIKCNWPPYGRDFVYNDLTKEATGRFCNGKLISDFLTEKAGLPLGLPHGDSQAKGAKILPGINTASSGSGWYDGTASLYNVAGLTRQIEWVKEWQHDLVDAEGLAAAAKRVEGTVFVISTGANDWVNNFYNNIDLQIRYSKTSFREFLLDEVIPQHITSLYNLGARKIAVVGMPPLGCLPSQITIYGEGDKNNRKCIEWLQDDSKAFNEGLVKVMDNLTSSLPNFAIVLLDAFPLITDAATNPSKYGLVEGDQGCCGTGLIETGIACTPLTKTCKDASQYLFWDSYHPTEAFNRQAADIFWEVMKKPFGLDTTTTSNQVVQEHDDL